MLCPIKPGWRGVQSEVGLTVLWNMVGRVAAKGCAATNQQKKLSFINYQWSFK
jgi:hypothetical protein